MGENVRIFAELYYRPARALSAVLDRGSFAFAAILAVMVYFLVSTAASSRVLDVAPEGPGIEQGQDAGQAPPEILAHLRSHARGRSLLGFDPTAPMMGLIPMSVVFVPAAVLMITWWDALGSASVILRRDYMPMLVCCLMSWSAAYLPSGLLLFVAPSAVVPWLLIASLLTFLILAVLSVRTVMGASVGHAAGAIASAVVSVGVALLAYSVVGGLIYYVASPMMLYFGYMLLQQDLRLLSGGLSSRQSLRRHLEASTLNPRDGDAHYQIGLIYQQRRNYAEAIPRFERAIEIDPSDPDPHYQLGRIWMEQKRYAEARGCFAAAAAAQDRHSSSDVWRELGAADLELGQPEQALGELEKFVDRHGYDPEGLLLLGRAFKKLGRTEEARGAWKRCVESVETLPSQRRRQLNKWKGLAQAELRGL